MAWSWPRGIARSVVGEVESRFDGCANVLSGLGYEGRDRRLGAFITTAPTLNEPALSDLYSGDALARRICELPANEQTRQWISFSSDGDADAGKQVLQHLQTIGAQSAVRDAKVWARLFGGCIILLGTDDGRRPYEPLKEHGIRSLEWLAVLDRHAVEIAGHDNMHAQQEAELRPQLEKLLRLVLRTKSGPTRGKERENWSFAFNPLWQLTEAEIAEARNKQAQTDQIYISNTVLDPMEVRSSRFGGDAYSNETAGWRFWRLLAVVNRLPSGKPRTDFVGRAGKDCGLGAEGWRQC